MPRIGNAACLLFSIACLASVAGCHVGPDPYVPHADVQPFYRHLAEQPVQEECADLSGWWQVLDDPILNTLVQEAVTQNLDLRQASMRILEARFQRGVVRADRLPTIDGDASYMFQKFSTNGAQFGFLGGGLGGGGGFPSIDQTNDAWSMGLNGNWEIDVFGRVFRNIEAAEGDIGANIWDFRDVVVMMLSDLSTNYVQARTFQQRIEIARDNLKTQEQSLELTEKRFKAGVTNELDVAQARATVATTEAAIPSLEASYQQTINRISTLVGRPPGHVDELLVGVQPIPSPKYELAIGIPADLLRRRPDIRKAERQVAAQTSRIGVAEGDLYPKFFITGTVGLDAQDLSQLFTFNSMNAMIGPSVRWDILAAGRIRSNIRVQEARQETLVAVYQQAVLRAAEEVDNALIGYDRERRRRRSLKAAVTAYERALDLSQKQYKQGTVSFQRVIDSQRLLLESQDQLALTDGNVTVNLISLYRALGGGWQDPGATAAPGTMYVSTVEPPELLTEETVKPPQPDPKNSDKTGASELEKPKIPLKPRKK